MGDNVSLLEALMITGFSMLVVFLGLILISVLIGGLKKIGEEKKDLIRNSEALIEKPGRLKEDKAELIDDEELVAVIAAAIAASMGVSIPELNIKAIKRIPQSIPAWSIADRSEQMSRKL